MSSSLQSRLLRFLALLALLAVFLTAGLTVMSAYLRERGQAAAYLTNYISERGQREEKMFNLVRHTQASAETVFTHHFEQLSQERVNLLMDRFFPEYGDGTRRSADALYDGTYVEGVGPVSRMGAYLSGQNAFTDERKRYVVAALLTIATLSHSIEGQLESLWFISEDDDVIIFAPARPDKLIFYRKDAGPDFDMTNAAYRHISAPENNKDGRTLCTPLSRLMYVESGESLTTGCQTPLRRDGEQLGIWGTTLPLADAFRTSLQDVPMAKADLFFITSGGELIAHRDLLLNEHVRSEDVQTIEDRIHPNDIATLIAENGVNLGPTQKRQSLFSGNLDVVYHLKIPDWYLVVRIPHEALLASALKHVSFSFFASLTVLLLAVAALAYAVRRDGIMPLNELAKRFTERNTARGKTSTEDDDRFGLIKDRDDEVGHLARILGAYQDEVESYTSELEKKIAQRTRELERANDAKSRFLATMSHELRTPMNGIMGIAGALQKTELSEDQREMAELITNSAGMLERQLSDVLDVSKIEAGQLELSKSPFNLQETIRNATGFYQPMAREKGIELKINIDPSCETWFIGDGVRLRQIISNLTSNAIKFTSDGYVKVSATAEWQEEARYEIRLLVEDTGIGMNEDTVQEIFSPYRQADGTIYENFGGTGLGLSICKSLMDLMGGTISVQSRPGKGTLFCCEFDLTRCETRSHEPVTANMGQTHLPETAPKVLVAEDHAVNRRVIEIILNPLGFEVVAVRNGQEAVDAATDAEFALILMDIRMPEKDGLTAIREIRTLERETSRKPSKIITLSANADASDVEKSYDAGADLHVSKPITPERLIDAISGMLSEADAVDASLTSSSL